ncbi:MAG: TolC family protein [Phycisphaeraceae bacterium]
MLTLAGGCASQGDGEGRALARWVERDAAGFAAERPAAVDADDWQATQRLRRDTRETAELGSDADLPAMIGYAMMHNPGLRSAFQQWRAALARVPQARAQMDPRLRYSYFVEQMMMRQNVGLSQTFEWWEKLKLRGEIATAEARAAEQRFEADRLALVYDISDAWAEWAYLAQATNLVRANLAILESAVQAAEAGLESGRRPLADVTRAELELEQVADELASLEASSAAVSARLNAALGRPADAPLPEAETLPSVALEAAESQLLAWLSETNPTLRARTAEATARRRNVKLARQNWIPDLTVGVAWQDGVTDRGDAVELMAGVNLPIWRERLDAERAEALAQYAAATNGQHDELNQLEARVRLAHYRFRDAARRVALYEDRLLDSARRSLEAAEAAYAEGQVPFEALTQAQTTLLTFELTHQRARRERFQRLAELEMLVGRPLRGPADHDEDQAAKGGER